MSCRKVGRPLGGKLSVDDKIQSVTYAKEQRKKWRIENPERYAEHMKNYRANTKNIKEITEFEIIHKFLKRIKCISINEE